MKLTILDLEVTPGLCVYCDTKLPPSSGHQNGGRKAICCKDPECRRELNAAHKRRERAMKRAA